jgi:hypothetical protein
MDELESSIKAALAHYGFRCSDSGMGMGSRDLCFTDEVKTPQKIVYLGAAAGCKNEPITEKVYQARPPKSTS